MIDCTLYSFLTIIMIIIIIITTTIIIMNRLTTQRVYAVYCQIHTESALAIKFFLAANSLVRIKAI